MKNQHVFTRHPRGALIGWLLVALMTTSLAVWPQVRADDTPPETTANFLFLPLIQAPAAAPPTPEPTLPPRQWDPRLEARGAVLTEATPSLGQGYWRLVSARWYDEAEAGGRHHILVDLRDQEGQRMVDIPVRIYWGGGETILRTQAKPNEAYAVDFGMFDVAPSYGASPSTGDAADNLWGMGLGSIEQPKYTIHTSYGLVWQWTIHEAAATVTPTPTVTPPSMEETPTPTPTPTATEPSPTETPTPTVTPSPPVTEPTREWDPRLETRGVVLTPADVSPGQGYWRLVRARWYDEQESGGRHHIFMDLLDAESVRRVGAPMRIYWNGGEANIYTEAKPGEEYAANFGMNSAGPSYGAHPTDGHPADSVWGMGLGSIEQPYHAIQTSYGFVWQWTIKPPPATEDSDSGQ